MFGSYYMKITYISASILPSTKANSVHVMKMCNALANNGHDITLVGTRGKNKKNENIFAYYSVQNKFQLKLAKNNKLSSINRLLYAFKHSMSADIVYTRWIVAAVALILFTNKKIIYEHHAPHSKGLYKQFEALLVKSRKVVRHVFITAKLKDYYKKEYAAKIKNKDILVLPDGADLVENGARDETVEKIDCIYVGSFQKGKGVETVINLANRLPNIYFGIVGGNEAEVQSAKKLAVHNNIKWFGYLPHEQISVIINKSKIALLPNEPNVIIGESKQNIGSWTSPMKLFEYMAHKKAIIASDLEVLKEVLEHNRNSLLVSYDNLVEWEEAIKKYLDDGELLKRISLNAYEDLKKNYTWNDRAKKSLENLIISDV